MHTKYTYTPIEQIKIYVQLITTYYETLFKKELQLEKHFIPLLKP